MKTPLPLRCLRGLSASHALENKDLGIVTKRMSGSAVCEWFNLPVQEVRPMLEIAAALLGAQFAPPNTALAFSRG